MPFGRETMCSLGHSSSGTSPRQVEQRRVGRAAVMLECGEASGLTVSRVTTSGERRRRRVDDPPRIGGARRCVARRRPASSLRRSPDLDVEHVHVARRSRRA